MSLFFDSLKLHDGKFDIIEALKKHRLRGSLVTSLDYIGYHNLQHFKTGTIRPSRSRIFLLPLSMFMQKHSYFESIINRQIERFSSSGLIEKWSSVYRETARKQQRQPPKKLKFIEISGAYELCIGLYGVSTMLFIGEKIAVKVRYLHKLFDHV